MSTPVLAGFPKSLGAVRDYHTTFAQMASVGITGFLPIDHYQLQPVPAGLGWSADFAPPAVWEMTNVAIAEAKAHGIKIILPGSYFYPIGQAWRAGAADPLRRFIAAHGSDILLGIWSYDEPAHSGVTVAQSKLLKDRVKSVLPGLNIYMCHAPMKDEAAWDTPAKRTAYLNACKQHSAHADVIMFDVYAFPLGSANIRTPAGPLATTWQQAITGYRDWLQTNFPTKQRGMVVQSHQLADFYSDEAIAGLGLTRAQAEAAYPGPTQAEMIEQASLVAGESTIGWYGPSFQPSDASNYWVWLAGTV